MTKTRGFAAVIAGSLGLLAPIGAAVADEFYGNRTVTLIVSAGVGGGYDTFGRLFARHYGRHIPGQPDFVVQNMTGAGGMRAASHLFSVAPKDGSVLAHIQATAMITPLLSPREVQYHPPEFGWIGNLNQELSVCVAWHSSPIRTVQDIFDQQFIVGGTGAGTSMETYPNVLNNLFGTNIKIISGYKGGSDVLLAMERGELHGRCGSGWGTWKTVRPDWVRENKIRVLLQTALDKDPELPDVPWVMDLVKTDEQRAVLEIILAPRRIIRPILGPPRLPPERLSLLRSAFDATVKDPAFINDADQQKIEISAINGKDTAEFIDRLYRTPQHVRAAAADALNRKDRTTIEYKK